MNRNTPPGDAELRNVIQSWTADGTLPAVAGLTVWDIGCGLGGLTAALLSEGAAHVIASDIRLERDRIPPALAADPRVTLREGTVEELAPQVYSGAFCAKPDVLFLHLVTEHVRDLRSFFGTLRRDLPAGCVAFIHHDNYYQPTGHHDHVFVSLNPATWCIEPTTVPCWTRPERCAASEAHRNGLSRWQWGERSARTVGGDCDQCNYKLRSEPWAHLVHQDRFSRVWPERFYAEGMNKATSFQVKQFLRDAGFDVQREHRTFIANEPSDMLASQFTKRELQTLTITFRAAAAGE